MKKLMAAALAQIVAVSMSSAVFAADVKLTEASSVPAPVAKAKLIDINTATEEQLKAIPGVDEASARKIIAGRPYHRKEELKAKKVVPADVYSKIDKLIKALC